MRALLEVMFIDGTFHGRADNTHEWPASPMRMFSASSEPAWWHRGQAQLDAMRWLERQGAPQIITPPHHTETPYLVSQPSNELDVLSDKERSAWLSRLMRDKNVVTAAVFPSRVDEDTPLVYAWEVDDVAEAQRHVEVLDTIARHIHAVGHGEDVVACRARLADDAELDTLRGERWSPIEYVHDGGVRLRVPVPGTFDSLEERFQAKRAQVQLSYVRQPASEAKCRVVSYLRHANARRYHLIGMHDAEGRSLRADPRDAVTLAAMLRHAAKEVAESLGIDDEKIRRYICGHTEPGDHRRVAYLPLPAIGRHGTGDIGQAMLVEPPGVRDEDFARVVERLRRWDEPINSGDDRVVFWAGGADYPTSQPYRNAGRVFTSVSPVILPGMDERSWENAKKLANKALEHAGLAQLVERFELSRSPHWRGTYHAAEYRVADKMGMRSRYHMRIHFREDVQGPVIVGDGRYRGIGLFAATRS